MNISVIIWLIFCGVILVSSFSLGTYYLGEWKEGVIESAYYTEKCISDPAYHSAEAAKKKALATVSLPIWITAFSFTFVSIIGTLVILTVFM